MLRLFSWRYPGDIIITHSNMVKLKPGDRVDVRIKEATIISPYMDYDEIQSFEIVAKDTYGYYLYIPHYIYLKASFKADWSQCKGLGIHKRFLNENIIYIQENMINKIHASLGGLNCSKCNEFYQYAECNQPDGTLICYSCKQNPYR